MSAVKCPSAPQQIFSVCAANACTHLRWIRVAFQGSHVASCWKLAQASARRSPNAPCFRKISIEPTKFLFLPPTEVCWELAKSTAIEWPALPAQLLYGWKKLSRITCARTSNPHPQPQAIAELTSKPTGLLVNHKSQASRHDSRQSQHDSHPPEYFPASQQRNGANHQSRFQHHFP